MSETQGPLAWQLVHENERLRDEVTRLRTTLRCLELAGERRRVGGGSSPVDIKSSFISAKTLTAVLEALRSNWFFATDDDEDNNDDAIAATKMLEAEIAGNPKCQPTPTLMDEERAAVARAADRAAESMADIDAAILRGVLKRLG